MIPEELLELLLQQLPLNPITVKFVREVFHEVLREIQNLQNTVNFSQNWNDSDSLESAPSPDKIEDCAKELRKVIEFLKTAHDERSQFLRIFPEWERQRNDNIRNLKDIANSIHKSRKLCSAAHIVGGSIGVVGGAAIIGGLLFPPTLPAILGGIAAGAGGMAQVATSVTEAALLHRRIEEAKEICQQDKQSFDEMSGWFRRTGELDAALEGLFGINIIDIVLKDLKIYFGIQDFRSTAFQGALKACVGKILGHPDFGFRLDPSLQAAVTAIVLVVFLVQQRNRLLFQCVAFTHRLGFGLMTGLDANVHMGRYLASAFLLKKGAAAEIVPKAVARKIAVGTLAGIGMALDAANVVLNSIDLAKGSRSDEQEKIAGVAEKLKEDLEYVRDVYVQLRYNC